MELTLTIIEDTIKRTLAEDLADAGDITSTLTIPEDAQTTVYLRAREDGILAGLDVALCAFRLCDPDVKIDTYKTDSDILNASDKIARISGNARKILTAERTALNLSLIHI